ncbi:hypothetical protein PybrP1_011905 [[Pythium] brassicae (nom. inval.)]|nr:hypothetical protein PybrP1_011905 [[Pythium] brassicae (nom. inval.)]
MKIPTAAAATLTLLAAAVSPRADALTTQMTGLSATELRSWESFVEYAIEYEKEYRSLDNDHHIVQRRFAAFSENLDRIKAHNELYAKGEYSFELGVNALADLTNEEYKQRLGYKRGKTSGKAKATTTFTAPADMSDVPESWDWREHGVVTPVKNQGQCGSCWAFSAVAALESAYAISMGTLESFSEQELVDCVLGGIDTCNHGGEMHDGFLEVIEHHGGKIEREADYPYTAESRGLCKADDTKAIGHFSAYANVTQGDESALQAAIATKGVQSVAIDASSFTFQLYHHGVYSWPLCANGPDQLDHGVAAVGYGAYKGKDYWLVKNSWSDSWGMKGYIMMSRNKNNQCGIATDASYPIMTKDTVARVVEIERV